MEGITPFVAFCFYNSVTVEYLWGSKLIKSLIMRKLFGVLAGVFMMVYGVDAQQITGAVKDEQGKGLDKSTVTLMRAKDSSVVKLVVTNENGKYTVQAQPGSYLVSASYVGFAPVYSSKFELSGSGYAVPDLTIAKATGNLKEVAVTAAKPMVEVKADKTILNVEGTINAIGNDALELLRRSPGVMVDKDDNLSLAGKSGVQVYIDGKPSPLSGTDLANIIKRLHTAQIQAI
jgi:hypothetical protein